MGFETGVALALVRRPALLLEAIRTWFAMRKDGGAVPSAAYLAWRRFTAYGDHLTTASAQDLVNYLEWRREMRIMRSWERVP